MPKHRKLIVLLIDGLSADYFARHRARLPHLSELAAQGTSVTRLRSGMPAVSMPGRATMLTGTSAAVHGVYGNHLFDGSAFRRATPYDLAVPSIAGAAQAAGMTVASLGFGMVRPEDTALFVPPWWKRNWVRGDRFAKVPTELLHVAENVKDPAGCLAEILEDAFVPGSADREHPLLSGFAGDQRNLRATAALAAAGEGPDLILTEVLMPDTVQHQFGYESEAAHMSLELADMMVGSLMHQLNRSGAHDTVVALASDHGHAPIETAIYAETILPEMPAMAEGATLNVALHGGRDRDRCTDLLRPFGVQLHDGTHLPPNLRDRIATFVAPAGHSFEELPADGSVDQPTGRPKYVSSHGFRPGTPADDRIFILTGPGVSHRVVETAEAEQLAPTLARILGLSFPRADPVPPPIPL